METIIISKLTHS